MAQLSNKYWDCECDDKYIQRNSVDVCPICGARRDEMPDSHQSEVDEGMHFAEITAPLKRFMYTFGSDPKFPFQNGWVEVHAESWEAAHAKFRTRFPDQPGHEGIINCAFFYDEEQWAQKEARFTSNGYKCYEVIE